MARRASGLAFAMTPAHRSCRLALPPFLWTALALGLGYRAALDAPVFGAVYTALSALTVLVALAWRRWLLREIASDGNPPPLSPPEMAYLAKGGDQVARLALLSLLHRGKVRPVASGRPPRMEPWQPLGDPIAEAVLLGLKRRPQGSAVGVLRAVARRGALMAPPRRRLVELGLVHGVRRAWWARHGPMLVIAAVLVPGLARIQRDMGGHRPVAGLLLLCLALMGAAAAFWGRRPHRTARGDRLLRALENRYRRMPPTSAPESLLPAFALLGPSVLPVDLAMGLVPLLAPLGWRGLRGDLAQCLTGLFAPSGGGDGLFGLEGWSGAEGAWSACHFGDHQRWSGRWGELGGRR